MDRSWNLLADTPETAMDWSWEMCNTSVNEGASRIADCRLAEPGSSNVPRHPERTANPADGRGDCNVFNKDQLSPDDDDFPHIRDVRTRGRSSDANSLAT